MDILIIFSSFFIFGYSHSILASNKVKLEMVKRVGNKIAFYRLFYNVFSIVIFAVIYLYVPKPSQIIYDLQLPVDIIILVIQILSLFGIFWAGSFIDLMEFLGINQIKRYLSGTYNLNDFDEKKSFVIDGAYKFSRHPIYFFSIIFIGARPSMDVFSLTFFIIATSYFIIGSYYEEKKLLAFFGKGYSEYQKNVPMIIPYNIIKILKNSYKSQGESN